MKIYHWGYQISFTFWKVGSLIHDRHGWAWQWWNADAGETQEFWDMHRGQFIIEMK